LRASLITFVSIKYTRDLASAFDTLEIAIVADIGHGGQYRGERSSTRPSQRSCQDFAMFGFGAAAMRNRPSLERLDEFLVDPSHQQVRHVHLRTRMISMISLRGKDGERGEGRAQVDDVFERPA